MRRGYIVLVPLLFALGCAQYEQVKVTYVSDPSGGTLHKLDGEIWGQCPMTLWYDLDDNAIANGYLDVKGLMVRWPSGSERRSDKLLRIIVDGTDRVITFVQPGHKRQAAAPQARDDAGH